MRGLAETTATCDDEICAPLVGAVGEPLEIPAGSLLSGQKTITGSAIGSRHLIREMLQFAERHEVRPETEVVPMSDVNRAIDRVRRNEARYRRVLAAS